MTANYNTTWSNSQIHENIETLSVIGKRRAEGFVESAREGKTDPLGSLNEVATYASPAPFSTPPKKRLRNKQKVSMQRRSPIGDL